jgi:tRNA A37 threonylcarbamoyladenosine synthetase subunit TsaC/SUA5/YrdC
MPDHVVALALLEAHGAPLMSTSLRLPGDEFPLVDPEEIRDRLEHMVDLVVDGGPGGLEATTVLDLTSGTPELVRAGLGAWPLA